MEHNLLAASRVYDSVHIAQLASMLALDDHKTEKVRDYTVAVVLIAAVCWPSVGIT